MTLSRFATESDDVCVASVARGDQAAFAELVKRHGGRVLRLAQRILLNRADAEDALQDIFEKIWCESKNWKPGRAKYSTWLYRVTFNHCLNLAKKNEKSKWNVAIDEHTVIESEDDPIFKVMDSQQRISLLKAVNSLNVNQRIAVTLFYGQGISVIESSEILNLSVKATESLLMRAKKRIRDLLYESGVSQ